MFRSIKDELRRPVSLMGPSPWRWYQVLLVIPALLTAVVAAWSGFDPAILDRHWDAILRLEAVGAIGGLLYAATRWRTELAALRHWWPLLATLVSALVYGVLFVEGGGAAILEMAPLALCEEIIFRVVIADVAYRLVARRLDPHRAGVIAVVGSGVFFAAFPGHLAQSGWTVGLLGFVVSHAVFGLSRWLSGSTLVPMVLHVTWNFRTWLSGTGDVNGELPFALPSDLTGLLTLAVGLVLMGCACAASVARARSENLSPAT
jgi:membrane protease YdiL (CAAX protease family)